jgi:ribosomal protein L7/L12
MTRSPDPTPELIALASDVLTQGGSVDDATQALMQATDSPIDAIKSLRVARPGLSLADAKHTVDRHLSPRARQAHNDLLDQLERALAEPE